MGRTSRPRGWDARRDGGVLPVRQADSNRSPSCGSREQSASATAKHGAVDVSAGIGETLEHPGGAVSHPAARRP
ncbi:hypothetical protein AB0346_26425, partial [Nocardia beijingensis]|uniref:hypothetical protein n=1 Tax=Nocardia beijingensis TaxID=95162 RepID=UPI0034509A09